MKRLKAILVVAILISATVVALAQSLLTPLPNEGSFNDQAKARLNTWADQVNAVISNLSSTVSAGTLVVSNSVTSASVSSGDYTVRTNLDFTKVTVTLATNAAHIPLVGSWIELDNRGTAHTTTTNTLPTSYAPADVGRVISLQAAAAITDSIHIAESAVNVLAATNLTLTANDVVELQIVETNLLRQKSAVVAN